MIGIEQDNKVYDIPYLNCGKLKNQNTRLKNIKKIINASSIEKALIDLVEIIFFILCFFMVIKKIIKIIKFKIIFFSKNL